MNFQHCSAIFILWNYEPIRDDVVFCTLHQKWSWQEGKTCASLDMLVSGCQNCCYLWFVHFHFGTLQMSNAVVDLRQKAYAILITIIILIITCTNRLLILNSAGRYFSLSARDKKIPLKFFLFSYLTYLSTHTQWIPFKK